MQDIQNAGFPQMNGSIEQANTNINSVHKQEEDPYQQVI